MLLKRKLGIPKQKSAVNISCFLFPGMNCYSSLINEPQRNCHSNSGSSWSKPQVKDNSDHGDAAAAAPVQVGLERWSRAGPRCSMKGCTHWWPKKERVSHAPTPVFGAAGAAPGSPGAACLAHLLSREMVTASYLCSCKASPAPSCENT